MSLGEVEATSPGRLRQPENTTAATLVDPIPAMTLLRAGPVAWWRQGALPTRCSYLCSEGSSGNAWWSKVLPGSRAWNLLGAFKASKVGLTP